MPSQYENLPIESIQKHELGVLVKYKGGPTVLRFKPIYGRGVEHDDEYVDYEQYDQPNQNSIATSLPQETKASRYHRLNDSE